MIPQYMVVWCCRELVLWGPFIQKDHLFIETTVGLFFGHFSVTVGGPPVYRDHRRLVFGHFSVTVGGPPVYRDHRRLVF